MAIREIYQSSLTGGSDYQNNILHQNTKDITKIDSEILSIIKDLRDTLWAYPFCVGLSAPQIGFNYSITVINFERKSRDHDIILINPKILERTGKKDKKIESCMSVWGKRGEVERRSKILIEYFNIDMQIFKNQFEGMSARVIQHELDHLQGILYCDIIASGKKLEKADFFDNYKIIK